MGLNRGSVVCYTGHRMRSPDNPSGLAPDDEGWVAARIAAAFDEVRPVAICGSLASGADILCAEAGRAKAIPFHAWLPMSVREFLAVSVTPARADWQERFTTLLGQAVSVTHTPPSPQPFVACAAAAMDGACALAALHRVSPVQLAIWNGQVAGHASGTFADIEAWRARGLPRYLISVPSFPV